MNDATLERKLHSIGMWCFVKYFDEFCDYTLSQKHIATLIVEDNPKLKWAPL